MFQKCPKCNGEGALPTVVMNGDETPYRLLSEKITCPVCLGEFVIHEEQGVPPSKVTLIPQIDAQVLTKEQAKELAKRFKEAGIRITDHG